MRLLSLFAGIGGFELGLERSGYFETVAQCEIDPYCNRVLAKHWPDVRRYGDIRELDGNRLVRECGRIDAICGGFPCQDISTAGKGAGIGGSRSGLWKEYARIIGEIRPRYVIVENVSALLSRGMGTVLADLSALGYDAEWHCIPASYCGAPHNRDRLWIIAYPKRGKRRQEPYFGAIGRMGRQQQSVPWESNWQDALAKFRRMDDGLPRSVASCDGYRNAVVPQIPELIGRAIGEYERLNEPA